MSKRITDTTKLPPEIKLLHVLGGTLETLELEGQREAVGNSSQLPVKGLIGAERPVWEAMGIKILLPALVSDPLFCAVELPSGWKKAATDHQMWNNLLDDKGRVRGTFFYKAAFYDRDAFIRLEERFRIGRDYDREMFRYQVTDSGKVVFRVEADAPLEPRNKDRTAWYAYSEAKDEIEKKLTAQCEQWLNDQGFPNYKDPSLYWD